jgi:hypothetical protein
MVAFFFFFFFSFFFYLSYSLLEKILRALTSKSIMLL